MEKVNKWGCNGELEIKHGNLRYLQQRIIVIIKQIAIILIRIKLMYNTDVNLKTKTAAETDIIQTLHPP